MNRGVLALPLTPAEVQHFTHTARRIAAILLLVADDWEGYLPHDDLGL